MKEEIEVQRFSQPQLIPITYIVPETKEFVRGGIAALSNIVGTAWSILMSV